MSGSFDERAGQISRVDEIPLRRAVTPHFNFRA